MAGFCGLCQCEDDGDWEKHVEGEQHQANLADPSKMGAARLAYESQLSEIIYQRSEDEPATP